MKLEGERDERGNTKGVRTVLGSKYDPNALYECLKLSQN